MSFIDFIAYSTPLVLKVINSLVLSQPIPPRVPLLPKKRPSLRGRHVVLPTQSQVHVVRRTKPATPRHLRRRHVRVAQQIVRQPHLVQLPEAHALHPRQDEHQRAHLLRLQPVAVGERLHVRAPRREVAQVVVHHAQPRRRLVPLHRHVLPAPVLVVAFPLRERRDVQVVKVKLRLRFQFPLHYSARRVAEVGIRPVPRLPRITLCHRLLV